MIQTIRQKIKKFLEFLSQSARNQTYKPIYRLVEINHTKTDEYIVTVQMINKNFVFETRPEEILANDALVDQFSPRDVRALTYLGYLSLNNPKYKILAQRLSEEQDKMLFVLRKNG